MVNAKRFNRKVINKNKIQYILTGTILFRFSGEQIPVEISIYNLPTKVIPYMGPIIQCYNCCLFGETSKLGKSKITCRRYGEHEEKEIGRMKSIHCKINENESNDRQCLAFTRHKISKKPYRICK